MGKEEGELDLLCYKYEEEDEKYQTSLSGIIHRKHTSPISLCQPLFKRLWKSSASNA